MGIRILKPGLLTTVQDTGRYGYQQAGVSVSGAMDSFSLRLANLLAGNPENAGALELTLLGPAIEFTEDALIALAGADLGARVGGEPVPNYRPVAVKKGSVLTFAGCKGGFRAYLAIAGGVAVARVLGSYSTYLSAKLGGLQGRPLKAGDLLPAGCASEPARALLKRLLARGSACCKSAPWGLYFDEPFSLRLTRPLRVTAGPHYELLGQAAKEALRKEQYLISPASNRMGYRLEGPALTLPKPLELLSTAAVLGTVQVPPDGKPIILMAERQSTGGYPQIAQLLRADVDVLAQLKPGDTVRFQLVDIAEAEASCLRRGLYLREVKKALAGYYSFP